MTASAEFNAPAAEQMLLRGLLRGFLRLFLFLNPRDGFGAPLPSEERWRAQSAGETEIALTHQQDPLVERAVGARRPAHSLERSKLHPAAHSCKTRRYRPSPSPHPALCCQ